MIVTGDHEIDLVRTEELRDIRFLEERVVAVRSARPGPWCTTTMRQMSPGSLSESVSTLSSHARVGPLVNGTMPLIMKKRAFDQRNVPLS